MPVDSSIELPGVPPAADPETCPRAVAHRHRPALVSATSTGLLTCTYEDWVAAGKPCLRQSCGHNHGDHIPSEGMECNVCDCLLFVGFAHEDHP